MLDPKTTEAYIVGQAARLDSIVVLCAAFLMDILSMSPPDLGIVRRPINDLNLYIVLDDSDIKTALFKWCDEDNAWIAVKDLQFGVSAPIDNLKDKSITIDV
jgi:hypothetical protein